jgi:hypothetical protein
MNNNIHPAIERITMEEFLPEGLPEDDQGPEPRDQNDEDSWEDDIARQAREEDEAGLPWDPRDDTPFLTEDNLWEDMHDTGDW